MSKLETIEPRGSWLLVKPVKKESQELDSGIVLPDTEEPEQKAAGFVQAVGPKVEDIKVDDKIIYGAYAGETLKRREDGKEVEYKLLLEEDVVAFLKTN